MSRRAIPAVLLVLIGLIGMVVVGRDATERETPFFAATGGTWMPAVGASGSLTGSWFCPGVPTSGEGVGGSVVVSNRDAAQVVGRYMVLTEEGVVADESFTVGSWTQTTIDVDALTSAPFASVVVEIEGGGALVEQRAEHPLGDSVAACSNDTSDTWYVADGYTLGDSVETLILTNPFDEPVVASLRFSTEAREAQPGQFGGFTVPPRSVRTIRIAELGARDEPIIAVAVETTAGRLVVGRAQEYNGGGRFGYDISLAAPALRDQWWFADGERSEGVTETYSIYNPTDEEVEVTVFFGGLPLEASAVNEGDPIVVPPLRAVIFDPTENRSGDVVDGGAGEGDDAPDDSEAAVDGEAEGDGEFPELQQASTDLPEGRHATVFSTLAQPSIVVERVLTRPADGSISTSVVLGAPPRPDGFVPNTWHMGIGPTEPTEDALIVYNIDQVEAAITVSVVGPDGPSAVPSLTDVPLPSGSIITVDLVDPALIGREIIVVSSSRVFIERSLPRGNDLPGRSGSWLLPQSG
ncbi:MAG: DUF5719 family protein [Ilumatobacter sp.]|uniref:DUF5719 family protein n=1 Tax=Ilumatobacter sp. TaxID=1967498 RepID=UPI003C712D1A